MALHPMIHCSKETPCSTRSTVFVMMTLPGACRPLKDGRSPPGTVAFLSEGDARLLGLQAGWSA
eukprot:915268-Heterocapsa_arctica.AAC.1